MSETLNNQVENVTAEKDGLVEEANRIITRIRQMEYSLDGSKRDSQSEEDNLTFTYPLTHCLKVLKEKHSQMSKLHRERFEQVKSKSSSSPHLEAN